MKTVNVARVPLYPLVYLSMHTAGTVTKSWNIPTVRYIIPSVCSFEDLWFGEQKKKNRNGSKKTADEEEEEEEKIVNNIKWISKKGVWY